MPTEALLDGQLLATERGARVAPRMREGHLSASLCWGARHRLRLKRWVVVFKQSGIAVERVLHSWESGTSDSIAARSAPLTLSSRNGAGTRIAPVAKSRGTARRSRMSGKTRGPGQRVAISKLLHVDPRAASGGQQRHRTRPPAEQTDRRPGH